jgi:hypothetical protein
MWGVRGTLFWDACCDSRARACVEAGQNLSAPLTLHSLNDVCLSRQ